MHKKVSKNKIGFLSTLWLIDLSVGLISAVTLLLHGVGVVHADLLRSGMVYVGKSEHNNTNFYNTFVSP